MIAVVREVTMAKARRTRGTRAAETPRATTTRAAAKARRGIFAAGLGPTAANAVALTPLSFLPRTAAIHPDRTAIVHGERRIAYRDFHARVRRLASALAARGVGPGDTVSVVLPNVPAMLELHHAVPMLGAVLNAINTRLDARTIAYILAHGEARVLLTDREYSATVGAALAKLERRPLVIDLDDPLHTGPGERLGAIEYEDFIVEGSADFDPPAIPDEWQPIALNYTSGTTGNPKGVVFHHRGTYLETIGHVLSWHLPPGCVFLWTLPMFHANGWCFPWSVTAMGGTHVCLRRVDPALIFRLIAEHRVTNMVGAPTVLSMLINAPEEQRVRFDHIVDIQTGGAAPPAKIIQAMNAMGFRVQHIYGLTEVLGPSTLCAWQDAWNRLSAAEQAAQQARQGVRYHVVDGQMVADSRTLARVPADGRTMGEVMLRGNTVMLGYLKDREATDAALAGGWFHTGDLAVEHPDGYIEIKDRLKDIIISGGENIASIEVEAALLRHPAVALAAVVARPDEKWGETPCAFVQVRPGMAVTEAELIAFARDHLPHFAAPRTVRFGPLPTTATGKIQKYELRERARGLSIDVGGSAAAPPDTPQRASAS
jgi:fatty-acyl-CoA synthase